MSAHTYPDKILPTVRSDMMAYHRHGYTFDEYCDRNTHGRNYGKELYPIWEETLTQFKEDAGNDSVPAGQNERQNRRRVRQQHV